MTTDNPIMDFSAKKPRQRLSPEARNAQLLNLAVELTAQKGVGRVGHGDIAKAAQVSTGTVFNYFPTTEALNFAVIERVQEETLSLFKGGMDDESAAALLMAYSERLLNLVESQPAFFKVFLSWSQSFDDPFRAQFLTLKKSVLAALTAVLGPRNHADIDAHIIYGTGLLYAQMKLEGYPDEDLTKLAMRVADLMV